jgi:hypothetical protein
MLSTIIDFMRSNIGWFILLLFIGAFIGAASLAVDDENPE